MSEMVSSEVQTAKAVLHAFATSGVQKTSMQDLAKAVGVSRQSVYKRFGSKESCYAWAIDTYLANMYHRIFTLLEGTALPPASTLLEVFKIFVGEAMKVVSKAHGTEVFDQCLKTTHASEQDWPLRFRARLADYLNKNELVAGKGAEGAAFVLISAGKGLMLEERSNDVFIKDMTVIINSVINNA